jgi:hypothetical protein
LEDKKNKVQSKVGAVCTAEEPGKQEGNVEEDPREMLMGGIDSGNTGKTGGKGNAGKLMGGDGQGKYRGY